MTLLNSRRKLYLRSKKVVDWNYSKQQRKSAFYIVNIATGLLSSDNWLRNAALPAKKTEEKRKNEYKKNHHD